MHAQYCKGIFLLFKKEGCNLSCRPIVFAVDMSENEFKKIFTKTEGRKIQGVVILSIDRKEAAFVNIVGTMDFASLGKISTRFDIPQLDTLKSK